MNQGFFSTEEIDSFQVSYRPSIDGSRNCLDCGLDRKCKNPKMPYSGEGQRNCLIIGEAQGPDEDRLGTQFIGKVGQFLRLKTKVNGCDFDRDFWKVNAIGCFPNSGGKIMTPTPQQIALCNQNIEDTIDKLHPNSIWLFGGVPITSLYQKYFTHLSPSLWRGLCIPDQRYKAWVNPMFHPSYIQRKDKDQNLSSLFTHDLRRAISNLNREPVPDYTVHGNLEILTNINDVAGLLCHVLDNEHTIAFDYETTGVKPQALNHKIVAISVAFGEEAYSFPFEYRSFWREEDLETIADLWIAILESPDIEKVAHNLSFEHIWSKVILGADVKNWVWDTCIAAHCLDNRSSFTDLYFQTFVNFGILPWGKELERFLKADGKEYNTIEEAPLPKLLEYNMMDSRYTMMLYNKQFHEVDDNPIIPDGFDLFMKGALRLSDIQLNGICLDSDYYATKSSEVAETLSGITSKLNKQPEERAYFNRYNKVIKWNSPQAVGDLFYSIIGIPVNLNEEGEENYSTDKKALEDVTHPIARMLLDYRKYDKILGTYLKPFIKGNVDGKIYPQYSLNIPRSFRSSSSNPNWQNIPIRDEDAKQLCRGGVMPSKGRVILSGDFKGIEVGTSACYHRDPNMIMYVSDKSTDMHRDGACDIWLLPQPEISDDIRFYAKNCWTFPQFYGDWYKSCAASLWRNCINLATVAGVPLLEHLKSEGINSFDEFVEHCQDVENIMWKERFKVYDKWKDDIQVLYRKNGYYDSLTGFRYQGYMSKKELCNYPIQGTAFHLMLWCLIYICDRMQEMKMESWNNGQIHDDMIFDAVPQEVDTIMSLGRAALVAMRKRFPWICVPFSIKWNVTDINASWGTQHVIKV